MFDEELESRLLRFEQAWAAHRPPDIAAFLDDPFRLETAGRRRLLVELICVDLEFRWRSSHAKDRKMLEDYVARFPELSSLDGLPLELIGEEYRVRRQWGDRPSAAAFSSRFHVRHAEIEAEMRQIDRELEDELAEMGRLARLSTLGTTGDNPPELCLDAPLLSHQDFHLRRLIGAGRMGKVYEARQRSTGREVAVKFLRKTLLRHPAIVERFIGEARTIARLRHPNIVGTHGLGRTTAGAWFIVMELVIESNLATVVASRRIDEQEAIRWAIAVCDALEHAHERGIVHCDLKPANLLLDAGGIIRVTDFGLARSLTVHTPWTAEVEGTAPFMAPEQVSSCWGPIDQRTDVYGLGAVLFTLLTSRPPWVGRRLPDILAQVVSAVPVVSPASIRTDLSTALVNLCRACLAKAPGERPASVAEVRVDLYRLLDESSAVR